MSARPAWQDRLWSKAASDANGCWIWHAGSITPRGYAMFGGPGARSMGAHRWAYVAANGPIPEGLEVDHLCNVPLCINPSHLEAVTPAENMRRRSERQTHCKRGHEFTEENTRRNAKGRACKTCIRLLHRGYAIARAEGRAA
jgi:hypothetical protein